MSKDTNTEDAKETKIKGLRPGLTHLSLEDIVTSKEVGNRPINKDFVAELADSIAAVGLDTALTVWNGSPKGEKGAVIEVKGVKKPASILVAGRHRREALRLLRSRDAKAFQNRFPDDMIPVNVIDGSLGEILAAQLRENVTRYGMDNADVLPILIRMRDEEGMKPSAIAKSLGKSKAWVSQIFAVETELGDEGVEAVKSGEVKLSDARKAAKKVKDDKKAGKTADPKKELEKAKASRKTAKDAGKERLTKRVSAKKLLARYDALPSMALGKRNEILLAALSYLAGVEDQELPPELADDTSDDDGDDDKE